MTEAEKAFAAAAAEAEIARVAATGETRLDLSDEAFHALEEVPESVAGVGNLQFLFVDSTQINDIAPLAALANLQTLSLDNTQVSDLTPLAGLIKLYHLYLNNTQISDLAPLADLPKLLRVFVSGTPVTDLRPLLSCPALATDEIRDVSFADTEATRRDPELARLAEVEDDRERTDQTLAYLRTLPAWPAPLAGERATQGADPQQPEPEKPAPRPAPLQVAFVDGMLREVGSDTGLAQDAASREAMGRAALADYLRSFDAAQLARIENALPRLGKALNQLNAALTTEDAFNPIAAGMQGERVIRLSKAAPDRLMEEDGEDVAHFSVQVALYLDRFLVWQAYKEDATLGDVPVAQIAEALPDFESVYGILQQSDWASDAVVQGYGVIWQDFRDNPTDALAAKGLHDASREAIVEIVAEALNQQSALVKVGAWQKYKDAVSTAGYGTAGVATVGGGVGASVVILDAVTRNITVLMALSTRFPGTFTFVKQVLEYFGYRI